MSETLNTGKRLISAIYDILNNNLRIYNKINTKKKWESNLNIRYNDNDCCNMLEILLLHIMLHIDCTKNTTTPHQTVRDVEPVRETCSTCSGNVLA